MFRICASTVEQVLAGAKEAAEHAGHDADAQPEREANPSPLQRDREVGTENPVLPQLYRRARMSVGAGAYVGLRTPAWARTSHTTRITTGVV